MYSHWHVSQYFLSLYFFYSSSLPALIKDETHARVRARKIPRIISTYYTCTEKEALSEIFRATRFP